MFLTFALPVTMYAYTEVVGNGFQLHDALSRNLMSCLRGVYGDMNVDFHQGHKGIYSIYNGKYTIRFSLDEHRMRYVHIEAVDETIESESVGQNKNVFDEIKMIYNVFVNACVATV